MVQIMEVWNLIKYYALFFFSLQHIGGGKFEPKFSSTRENHAMWAMTGCKALDNIIAIELRQKSYFPLLGIRLKTGLYTATFFLWMK